MFRCPSALVVLVLFALANFLSSCASSSSSDRALSAKLRSSGVTSVEIETKGTVARIAKIGTRVSPEDTAAGGAEKLLRACYEVAASQEAEYFVVLRQETGKKNITTVGLVNRPKPNIPEVFGAEYSATDKSGKPLHVFSVAEIAKTMGTTGT